MRFPGRGHLDQLSEGLLRLTIPHHKNDHRPLLLRSSGLFAFLIALLISQAAANYSSHTGKVLGFATNISAAEVINLTNKERVAAGLAPLKENSALDKAASLKANDMFSKDYWAHFAPDGTSPWYFFSLVGYQYSWAGENLARDFATSGGVVSAWMASSGHRANILNQNFTEIGLAVVNGNLQGEDTTLVVQLFAKPVALAASPQENVTSTPSQPAKLEESLNVPASSAESSKSVGKSSAQEKQVESLPGSSKGTVSFQSLFENTTSSQKVTLALLLFVATLFVIDSVIVFRRRHLRVGSHSFAHAAMILLLIIAILLYGQGAVL